MNLVAYSFMSLYHVFDLAVGDPPPHGGAIRLHEEACVCTCKRACVCVCGGGVDWPLCKWTHPTNVACITRLKQILINEFRNHTKLNKEFKLF